MRKILLSLLVLALSIEIKAQVVEVLKKTKFISDIGRQKEKIE